MRIEAIHVGMPKELSVKGRKVRTGISKKEVSGPVRVLKERLEGDGAANTKVHGRPFQAVYFYPREHYPYWQRFLGNPDLPPGSLGENIITSGLLETETRIGDRLRAGTALLEVTAPREPCSVLALKVANRRIIKEMLQTGYTGFYTRVLEEGMVTAGDNIVLEQQAGTTISVADLLRCLTDPSPDQASIRACLQIATLAQPVRERLEDRLV